MSSGTGDKLRGKGEELAGRAKEAAGDATDNERLQGEGAADQAKGQGRQAKGDVKDALDNLGDTVGDAVDKLRGKKDCSRARARLQSTHATDERAGRSSGALVSCYQGGRAPRGSACRVGRCASGDVRATASAKAWSVWP